jgi:hypothetical protein
VACGGDFDLLGDVQHVTMTTSSVGVRSPYVRQCGWPPWRGMQCDEDSRGRLPWGDARCGACIAASIAEGVMTHNIVGISLDGACVAQAKCLME